ncbi:MAG: hypothetical protein V7718_06490 [Porticoccus sp.]
MNTNRIITISFLLVLLSGCVEEKWEGFVYPNANDLTISKNVGTFSSLEACRDAALSILSSISSVRAGDYECGLNCEARSDLGGMKVCKKTER